MEYKLKNYATDFIGQIVDVKIDRPLNSKHPKHGFLYKLNYGFIPNTNAPDGEGIDAYIIGINEPVSQYTGKCIAVIHRTNDDDDKLVVVPEDGVDISDEDIKNATKFQEQFFESEIIR
ncbi:inorganic diphosphatase [Candidatus Azambacteria bacterium]|nr:inorganic diphosphatase [Candidatus Azambacteria bacterium]